MEDELKKLADQVHQFLQERRLYLFRTQIQQLQQILQALIRYKSECTSTIATVKALLLRKRELKFQQNHSRALQGLFYEMVKHNKDKTDGEVYRLWFEKLQRLKSYSFEPSEFNHRRGLSEMTEKILARKDDFKQFSSHRSLEIQQWSYSRPLDTTVLDIQHLTGRTISEKSETQWIVPQPQQQPFKGSSFFYRTFSGQRAKEGSYERTI